jgi:NDP-sugar pyrophosphorylase family protein
MKAMILAAGQGTRLRPLTLDRPKPMLPVAGRPMLEYTMAWLGYHGIRQVAINLHYQPRVIMDHFGDGSAFGMEITYSVENIILGTAGGLKNIAYLLSDEPFVVIYGDVLTDLDLGSVINFHDRRPTGAHLSMCLYRVENPSECGIVALDERGRITRFVEKPRQEDLFSDLANTGIMIVDPEIMEHVPASQFYDFGRDLFPCLLKKGVPIYGMPLSETAFLIDIGTPAKYRKAQKEWPSPQARLFMEEAGKGLSERRNAP